jgi:hypothetical protein
MGFDEQIEKIKLEEREFLHDLANPLSILIAHTDRLKKMLETTEQFDSKDAVRRLNRMEEALQKVVKSTDTRRKKLKE